MALKEVPCAWVSTSGNINPPSTPDGAQILWRDPASFFANSSNPQNTFNPWDGDGGGSITAPSPRINAAGINQTIISETLTDYSIVTPPPTNTNNGNAVAIGRIAIPETSAGEKIVVRKTQLVNGYYTQWTAIIAPPWISQINFYVVGSVGRNLTFEGTVTNYAYEVESNGSLPFQAVKRAQPFLEVFDGKQSLTFPMKALVEGVGVLLSAAQFSFSFSTPIPALSDRSGDGLIKVRAKDSNGLVSPWYTPKLAANAKITVTDGEFHKMDASASTSLDGANTYTWFAQNQAGAYLEISNKVARLDASNPTVVQVSAKDIPARGDDIVGLKVRVTNSNGLVSERTGAIFYKPQRGALHSPTGQLFVAGAINTGYGDTISNSVLVQRLSTPVSSAGASQIAGAIHPSLLAIQAAGTPTGEIALHAKDFKNFLWRVWKSDNNGQSWTAMAPSFTSPNIDYAHACALPSGGAAAVAVLKGSPNKLIFKRTSDFDNWPLDSEAVTVLGGVDNAPWTVLINAQGRNEIYITNGFSYWFKSLDGGCTWSSSA